MPALKLVDHKLRPGAILIFDDCILSALRNTELFAYLRESSHGFLSVTVPYSNGLDMVIKAGQEYR